MRFSELHEAIPYAIGGKEKIAKIYPYNAITLALPGRHAKDTTPKGGDFVVMVDSESMNWVGHQFTHTDLFMDLESKSLAKTEAKDAAQRLIEFYGLVVTEDVDPDKLDLELLHDLPGLHPQTFLHSVQCLAVAEHRRYSKFEGQFGGRYLPLRFGAGIVQGLWTAADAANLQRRGRPGVEQLERQRGMPDVTKELMK